MQRLFDRSPGPCPVCGSPDMSCRPEGAPESASGVKITRELTEAMAGGHRSVVQVWEAGRLKYGVGTPIPLVEAIAQRQVEIADLTVAQREEVLRHLKSQPESVERLKDALEREKERKRALKKAPKDRMVREHQVVRK